jgi:uncharacterized protein (TIGR02466 family)
MTVEKWFSTPIYVNNITGEELQKIQDELEKGINEFKSVYTFEKKQDWNINSASLSNPDFNRNFIFEYKQNFLFESIKKNLYQYMMLIEAPMHSVSKFKLTESWLTQTLKNEYHHTHSHSISNISGVYYYKTNEKDGDIFFETPVFQTEISKPFNYLPNRVHYTPIVGRLILFPGWLKHGTKVNTTDNERISLSFNISFI